MPRRRGANAYWGEKFITVVNATLEALAAQHADFGLDHVQPADVFGGVVEVERACGAGKVP